MSVKPNQQPQAIIREAIAHLDHVLPGQAPIHDFVHHNTLHGFQHLPFPQALAEFTALTGIDCYLSDEQFRQFYQQGRINDADLDQALAEFAGLDAQHPGISLPAQKLSQQQLYRLALLHDFAPITPAALRWQLDNELDQSALALWQQVLNKLNLVLPDWQQAFSCPDNSLQLDLDLVLSQQLQPLFARLGDDLSLRGLLLALTGEDILERVRPELIKIFASQLDEGIAAWRLAEMEQLGAYRAWRQSVSLAGQGAFQGLAEWQSLYAALPDDAMEAVIQQLEALGLPMDQWAGYLQRLALELPGWSGLINWRQTHPAYKNQSHQPPQLLDYLAIRLILDRCFAQSLCQRQGFGAARLDKLAHYFKQHLPEFSIRLALFNGQLPEHLQQLGLSLIVDAHHNSQRCLQLAAQIHYWQQHYQPEAQRVHPCRQGWGVFKLCQVLGITSAQLEAIDDSSLLAALAEMQGFQPQQRSLVWLAAYERHYQQNLLHALHANHNRGRWAQRQQRPAAQVIFCMDDREEGIRRHLEEHNPAIETLGAAGFFGMAINYQGLDDQTVTALCPVVVTPVHTLQEQAQSGQTRILARHQRGLKRNFAVIDKIFHGLRRDLVWTYPLLFLMAPLLLGNLWAKSFFPKLQQRFLEGLINRLVPKVATRLPTNAVSVAAAPSPEQPQRGFTDQEQADRVEGFLRNCGLTYGFAEWVVLMGHGSSSQNNPHLAAYDCGACSGRHGGPNARVFAAIANRSEIRQLLSQRGIQIPADTWFIGAEHNTCDETITYYDLDLIAAERLQSFQAFDQQIQHAQRMSAHERCRRLASAPRAPSPAKALRHFWQRSSDFSQARPELGHATNAAALVGRRALTQGAFFDRRLFLISYDPSQDPDGSRLEGILLAVGPVGAGINLEYYFSTVNNQRLGCGSKVPHNLTGFFAVMEGTASDLRTGLPQQMVEIHEAMRLQLVVEAKTTILEQIYQRQPALQELIGGGWLHLSSKDPDTGQIFCFKPQQGFVSWQPPATDLPMRDNSPDCYRQHTQPVDPLLIRQPDFSGAPS